MASGSKWQEFGFCCCFNKVQSSISFHLWETLVQAAAHGWQSPIQALAWRWPERLCRLQQGQVQKMLILTESCWVSFSFFITSSPFWPWAFASTTQAACKAHQSSILPPFSAPLCILLGFTFQILNWVSCWESLHARSVFALCKPSPFHFSSTSLWVVRLQEHSDTSSTLWIKLGSHHG